MRRTAFVLALLAVLATAEIATGQSAKSSRSQAAAPRGPARAFPWDKRVRQAKRYARKRAGSVSFAVISETGRLRGYRRGPQYSSASVVTMKSVCFSGRKFSRLCVPCM